MSNDFSNRFQQYQPIGRSWPNIRAAGVGTILRDSASACLQPDVFQPRQITPPKVKRYCHNHEPGVQILHPATRDDIIELKKKNYVFGEKSVTGISAVDCLKSNQVTGIQEYLQNQKEKIYQSSKKQPLEKQAEYNYTLPAFTSEPDFRFGIRQTSKFGNQMKEIICNNLDNDANAKELYKKTHSAYDVEEQVDRHYSAPFDKLHSTFGLAPKTKKSAPLERALDDSVKACLNNTHHLTFPKTQISKKIVEDFRTCIHSQVARNKNLLQGKQNLPIDFAYGHSNNSKEKYGIKDILNGFYYEGEMQPDRDLERNTRYVKEPRKLSAPEEIISAGGRRLGVPSIRYDLEEPKKKSVTDSVNYGRDPVTVSSLMKPSSFSSIRLDDDVFSMRRDLGSLNVLLRETSRALPLPFDELVKIAQDMLGRTQEEGFSIEEILYVIGVVSDWKVAEENEALSLTLGIDVGTVSA